MKNLTITVEDSVLEWARVEAARRGTSVSRMVGDFMAEMKQREDTYERAYLAWRTDERTWQGGAGADGAPEKEARSVKLVRADGQNGRNNPSGKKEQA
ncbi:DUF6364 family protein [Comamonas sp. 4034]|uniref:DUF6364 family protein n=1 Tax=Comamonas sp. 4034 TaxID=3156455 RepID=UPI003D1AE95E